MGRPFFTHSCPRRYTDLKTLQSRHCVYQINNATTTTTAEESGSLGQYGITSRCYYITSSPSLSCRDAHINICVRAGDCWEFPRVYLGPGLGHDVIVIIIHMPPPPDRRISISCHSGADSRPFFPFVFISLSSVSGRVFHFHLPRGPLFPSRHTWRVTLYSKTASL